MNEAILTKTLRQYRKVRGPDFHQPATRANQGKIDNGHGIEKVIDLCRDLASCAQWCVLVVCRRRNVAYTTAPVLLLLYVTYEYKYSNQLSC